MKASQHVMKRVALSAEFDEEHPALETRLGREDTDRVAVDPCETADDLAREQTLDLEEGAVVDDAVNERHHVVSLRCLIRNHVGDVLASRSDVA